MIAHDMCVNLFHMILLEIVGVTATIIMGSLFWEGRIDQNL